MRVYLIQNKDGIGYYTADLTDIGNILFDNAEDGESYTITAVEMPQEKFNNLPEFDGF